MLDGKEEEEEYKVFASALTKLDIGIKAASEFETSKEVEDTLVDLLPIRGRCVIDDGVLKVINRKRKAEDDEQE